MTKKFSFRSSVLLCSGRTFFFSGCSCISPPEFVKNTVASSVVAFILGDVEEDRWRLGIMLWVARKAAWMISDHPPMPPHLPKPPSLYPSATEERETERGAWEREGGGGREFTM